MQIIGINTLTLLDYPKHTSCIVFTAGCNFRCGFCHNPHYVLPEKLKLAQTDLIPEEAFFNFLKTRKGLLDGVVISGGEPTLQTDLIPFIEKIKQQNFLIKLDTNGTNPQVLTELIQKKLIDFVAMDIKTSPAKYALLTDVNAPIEKIKQSKDLILSSGIDYEFRTTLIKEHHTQQVLEDLAEFVKGSKILALQNFRNTTVLNPAYKNFRGFSETEMQRIAKLFQPFVEKVLIR